MSLQETKERAFVKMQLLISWHKKYRKLTAITVMFLLVSIIYPSYLRVVLLFVIYGGGLLLGSLILSPDMLLPNLLFSYVRNKKVSDRFKELSLIKKFCPVCGKEKCNRHRPELNIVALQPWTDIQIPERVNEALEEFFNLVLRDFVYTWYRDLSQDEAFVDEIRTSIRFTASVLLRRLQKVDIPTLVTDKVLKIALKHLHYCLRIVNKDHVDEDTIGSVSASMEQAILELYGRDLHCAARNRRSELEYLKEISDKIFPYVLPPRSLKCKSLCALLRELLTGAILLPVMDVIADPDIVNNLLLLFLDKSPLRESCDPPSSNVPIFIGYSQPVSHLNQKNLQLKLTDILSEPDMLFPFMQFMKAEASVNVLQFYLAIEEFNSKILTPELPEDKLSDLHEQLCQLYSSYIEPTASDCIRFDDDIISQLEIICNGPPDGVIKLQTSTPLFRAYEHAYDLLEHTFLPLFHQSDIYYTMLCGERLPTKLQRSGSKISKKSTDPLSRLGSKIKCVFKSSAVEGRPLSDDIDYGVEEADTVSMKEELIVQPPINNCVHVSESMNDIANEHPLLSDGPLRDLSAWRITIPMIVPKPDPSDPDNQKKNNFAFSIEIHRVDVLEKLKRKQTMIKSNDFEACTWFIERFVNYPMHKYSHIVGYYRWKSYLTNASLESIIIIILKRYHEFYVLEQKLKEFHGEFEDLQLPAKKTFVPKAKSFFDSHRESFEIYLQTLLTKPTLRGSQLLYSFLTSEQEFTTSFLENLNLGRKVKSGALKLVKERGQHLEPFLRSFLMSTESPKSKPSRWSDKDSDTLSISSEKMSNSIFNNNANMDLILTPTTPCRPIEPIVQEASSLDHLKSIFDAIVYLALHVYKVPLWLMKVLLMLRMLVRNTVDSFLDWYIGHKLDQVLQEHHIVKIIHLLRDVLFFDNEPARSEEDRRRRQDRALTELSDFIPRLFVRAVGSEKHTLGTKLVFDLLQLPRLNKQLLYMLVDVAIEELFPELTENNVTDLYTSLLSTNDD